MSLWASDWGYGYGYYNPYCAISAPTVISVYDYTQPVIVRTYREPVLDAAEGLFLGDDPDLTLEAREALDLFARARDEFKRGSLANALRLTEQAIRLSPEDTVLHEFYGVVLFSLRRYDEAAIVLNSLLAVTPGMDWETMSRLYASPDDYTTHLRLLEKHIAEHPDDAAAQFVLAYHYLVLEETVAATDALRIVVSLKPEDKVATQLLEDLAGESLPVPGGETARKTPLVLEPATSDEPSPARDTDLAGDWLSEQAGRKILLTIDESGSFDWQLELPGQPPRKITGNFELAGEILVLDGGDQGTFVGRVIPMAADQFVFRLVNGPEDDPGMTFQRK